MKTLAQVSAWRDGAAEEFGDPSESVGQLFAEYVALPPRTPMLAGDDVVFSVDLTTNALALWFFPEGQPLVLPIGLEALLSDAGVEAFGVERVAPGLWHLTPSLCIPGVIHAFVTLYGVPDPAPWERRIIVVPS